jgi:hypothetical protein
MKSSYKELSLLLLFVGMGAAHFVIVLQAIAHTMKSSYKELSLLLLFVGMGMLIFGR